MRLCLVKLAHICLAVPMRALAQAEKMGEWQCSLLIRTSVLGIAEYVELYTDWMLNKSVEEQFREFKRGFDRVCLCCPPPPPSGFDVVTLVLVCCKMQSHTCACLL